MKFLGTLSAVLTALYLAGLTSIPLLVCLIPIFLEIIIGVFFALQERKKQAKLWEKITELGEEIEKETKDKHE